MIYNLLNEESLPPMVPYLCWECRKTFLKVRAEQGEEEMTGKQLDRFIFYSYFDYDSFTFFICLYLFLFFLVSLDGLLVRSFSSVSSSLKLQTKTREM